MSDAGARRALMLPVGGAFHSPLMEPARTELAAAIEHADIQAPRCPIYQNVSAEPTTDPGLIRQQLVAQLTAPVRWTQTMQTMIADGATEVTEVGPGKVLQGLFKKVDRAFPTSFGGARNRLNDSRNCRKDMKKAAPAMRRPFSL